MELQAGFRGEWLFGAVCAEEGVAAGVAGGAALRAVGLRFAAIGEEGGVGFGEHLVLADEAFAPGVPGRHRHFPAAARRL